MAKSFRSSETLTARETDAHRRLALEAADTASSVLGLFEQEYPRDDRPRLAIEALVAWAKNERLLSMGEVRALSLAAHAAAREASCDAARYAARAAGQAVATWHVPGHARAVPAYVEKASAAANSR